MSIMRNVSLAHTVSPPCASSSLSPVLLIEYKLSSVLSIQKLRVPGMAARMRPAITLRFRSAPVPSTGNVIALCHGQILKCHRNGGHGPIGCLPKRRYLGNSVPLPASADIGSELRVPTAANGLAAHNRKHCHPPAPCRSAPAPAAAYPPMFAAPDDA